MVYFHNSIAVCNSVDQQSNRAANSLSSSDSLFTSKQGHMIGNKKGANGLNCGCLSICDGSEFAIVDVVIFTAVLCACGFLFFPCIKFITLTSVELSCAFYEAVRDEIMVNPLMYMLIAMGTFFTAILACYMVFCTSRKCGKPNCRGLRKAAKFDVKFETEECAKNSSYTEYDKKRKRWFEMVLEHHKGLEAELRMMAPPNGKAVIFFRARCGCIVGRLELPASRKTRKVRK